MLISMKSEDLIPNIFGLRNIEYCELNITYGEVGPLFRLFFRSAPLETASSEGLYVWMYV